MYFFKSCQNFQKNKMSTVTDRFFFLLISFCHNIVYIVKFRQRLPTDNLKIVSGLSKPEQ
jgi:hypothetical protein